jgi:CheY-like chemotaxis protein
VQKITEKKLGMLIANMSGEIHTSMNIIVEITDMMLEDDTIPAHAKESLQKVNAAGHALAKSIGNILDISILEAGRSDLSQEQQDPDGQERPELAYPDLSHARVLLVDDFISNMNKAEKMLRKYKMEVDCVVSGREAVDRIAAGEPVYDIVFMDYMMPEMDGMEATALIRDIDTKYAKNIPIIALTATAVAGSENIFLTNGFNAFLAKPLTMMVLDSVLQRWIKKASSL